MERAVNNGESWETLIKEWADRDIYSRIDYRKIFRPEMKTTVQELKRRGYTVALVSSTGPKLISRIVEEVGMRPEFDLDRQRKTVQTEQTESGDLPLYSGYSGNP